MNKVIGILTADWHLSSKAPIARSVEPDWYEAMKRPMEEVGSLALKYKCPVFCSGDIFHHWNSSAELINFAIENLYINYSVDGNHDLPLHNRQDIHKSAYWTLVKSQRINHVKDWEDLEKIIVFGFGHNEEPEPVLHNKKKIYLALVHKYIWSEQSNCFPGADRNNRVGSIVDKLEGFDAASFGDNHIGFTWNKKGLYIINCGSIMCRNSDQRDYQPRVGLLHEDGSILIHALDTSKDKWLDEKELKHIKQKVNLKGLLKEFKKISSKTINFIEILEQAMKSHEVSGDAKQELNSILEEVK